MNTIPNTGPALKYKSMFPNFRNIQADEKYGRNEVRPCLRVLNIMIMIVKNNISESLW